VPQDELMAVVIQKAPVEYNGAISMEMRSKADALTMEDLQDTMGNQYRIATSKSGANDDENEVGLFGVDNNSKTTRCYNCQQFGHRSYDCKNAKVERTDNGGGGLVLNTHYCRQEQYIRQSEKKPIEQQHDQ
jgi:hypothetical protein